MGNYKAVRIRNMALGDGTCRICIPLMAEEEDQIRDEMKKILDCAPDLIEWRADAYRGILNRESLLRALACIREMAGEIPVLFTFRTKEEGGLAGCTMKQYADMITAAAESGWIDLADLEYHREMDVLAPLIGRLRELNVKSVISCHDFERTVSQEELTDLYLQMQKMGGDVTKLAVMPGCREDVMTLLETAVQMEESLADRPFCAISMGRLGTISRIAAQFTGSAFTFAAAGRASAPGQAGADDMRTALRMLQG